MPIFPPGGGGSGSAAWLNPVQVYVSPTGSDLLDGTGWPTAKGTIKAALDYLVTKGGGELHFADGSPGHVWLRGDGLTVTGWHPEMPLRVIGHGKAHNQFGSPAAVMAGGDFEGGTHTDPLLWLSRIVNSPVVFENITPPDGRCNTVAKLGYDYRRNSDGTIAWADITSWNRTVSGDDGRATLTVSLLPGIAVTTATRTSNTVRLNFASQSPLPTPAFFRDAAGVSSWIKFTSTSGSFASGDYELTGMDNSANPLWIEYTETGSNVGPVATPGTWQSTNICKYDRIEVVSTDSNVPSTAYRVMSVTDATHFVVWDVYGYSPRSLTGTFTNPGQYVLQDRNFYQAGLYDVINVQGRIGNGEPDRFINGPALDFGGTSDGRVRFINTAMSGGVSATVDMHDPDRKCWLLMDPGSRGASGAQLINNRPNVGGVRVYGSKVAGWGVKVDQCRGDTLIGEDSPPAFESLEGNQFGYLYIDQCVTDDADPDVPNVVIDAGMASGDVRVTNCGLVEGPGLTEGGLAISSWSVRTESPLVTGQTGFWLGDRISGVPTSAYRNLGGLAQATLANVVDVPGSWQLFGTTKTSGQADPFGGTGAWKIAGGPQNIFVYDHNLTTVAGDRFAFGCWVKRASALAAGPGGYVIALGCSPSNPAGFNPFGSLRFTGEGEWQWMVVSGQINSVVSVNVRAAIGIDDTLYIFQPTVYFSASGALSDNEWSELVQAMRPQPQYLTAGMPGTMDGYKFIGHGGFGTDSANAKVVGGGSGQLTLTGSGTVYLPMYDKNGTTIIGWVAQLQATVNP